METHHKHAHDTHLVAEHFPLLLENRYKILSHPHLQRTWSPVLHLTFGYITGGGYVPISYLLHAWDRGLLTGYCPSCGRERQTKSFHLFSLSGERPLGSPQCVGCLRPLPGAIGIYVPGGRRRRVIRPSGDRGRRAEKGPGHTG